MSPKKILIPIDFSDCSINALDYATGLAEAMKSELVLMHTLNTSMMHNDVGSGSIVNELAHGIEEDVTIRFAQIKKKVPSLANVPYTTVVKRSFVNDAISAVVNSHDIDLIIMGTKGAHGLEEMIIGSNTYSVIRNSGIPVLAIPEKASFKSPRQIAFASDYKNTVPEDLTLLMNFCFIFASKIHVLHVSEENDISGPKLEQAQRFEQYLKKIPHVYQVLKHKNLEEGVEEYAQEHHIDMIVVMPRKHNLFELIFNKTLSRKIILHTRLPLLALPG
ncbi:universal stress protein [Fulvivirga sp. M361]|uniref:universal stress protein n=1 Tax=Fulvivirga sp. M361 TaxID=2594266 RepID=UPI0016240473|nr:universal stress protein [Fulvivirga sp. M361]